MAQRRHRQAQQVVYRVEDKDDTQRARYHLGIHPGQKQHADGDAHCGRHNQLHQIVQRHVRPPADGVEEGGQRADEGEGRRGRLDADQRHQQRHGDQRPAKTQHTLDSGRDEDDQGNEHQRA